MSLYMERHNQENQDIEREISNCLLLGKLADESVPLPNIGEERRAITKHKTIPDQYLIYIQCLSSEPSFIRSMKESSECYIGFSSRNLPFLKKIKFFEQEDKIDYLRDKLANKLILFKPKLMSRKNSEVQSLTSSQSAYHYNFEFLHVGDETVKDNLYVSVPRVVRDMSAARFEKSLLDRTTPFRLNSFPSLMETPEFIICDKYLYHVEETDAFLPHETNRTTYYCSNPENIKRLELPENWDGQAQGVSNDLSFITGKYAIELRDMFEKKGASLQEQIIIRSTPDPVMIEVEASNGVGSMDATDNYLFDEIDFIDKLKYLSEQEGLFYDDSDFYNFHTSMKTSILTILGGMSGTGKTRLARIYAKALGLENRDDLLILPISPSYTEPSDLLGFLNQQLGIYMESETGLVSFLKKAEENPDRLFMIIFDEMNLGQVEHYFSPFISILEMEEDDRNLTLFSNSAICRDRHFSSRIKIGNNILFVGTANFDETTKDFSKRLLDRTNVIYLEKNNFTLMQASFTQQPRDTVMEAKIDVSMYRKAWTKKSEVYFNILDADEISLLEDIHRLMQSIDAQTGVSFRIANAIGHFLNNVPTDDSNNGLLSRDRAFDYQIKQRLLTKIRGHREQIEQLVGTYDFEKNRFAEKGELTLLLSGEDWQLERSVRFLEQKARELTRNGYTL